MCEIAIVDYYGGNGKSVFNAFEKIEMKANLTKSKKVLENADLIVLPGVGAARATLDSLSELNLLGCIKETLFKQLRGFLGICVGHQILFEHSEEENTKCLSLFKGNVLSFDKTKLRVPLMGWNKVNFSENCPQQLKVGIEQDAYFYFVNSYYALPNEDKIVVGTSNYSNSFCSMIAAEKTISTQFHLEKSGPIGLLLLKRIVNYLLEKQKR